MKLQQSSDIERHISFPPSSSLSRSSDLDRQTAYSNFDVGSGNLSGEYLFDHSTELIVH
jgi:hypothetical protein